MRLLCVVLLVALCATQALKFDVNDGDFEVDQFQKNHIGKKHKKNVKSKTTSTTTSSHSFTTQKFVSKRDMFPEENTKSAEVDVSDLMKELNEITSKEENAEAPQPVAAQPSEPSTSTKMDSSPVAEKTSEQQPATKQPVSAAKDEVDSKIVQPATTEKAVQQENPSAKSQESEKLSEKTPPSQFTTKQQQPLQDNEVNQQSSAVTSEAGLESTGAPEKNEAKFAEKLTSAEVGGPAASGLESERPEQQPAPKQPTSAVTVEVKESSPIGTTEQASNQDQSASIPTENNKLSQEIVQAQKTEQLVPSTQQQEPSQTKESKQQEPAALDSLTQPLQWNPDAQAIETEYKQMSALDSPTQPLQSTPDTKTKEMEHEQIVATLGSPTQSLQSVSDAPQQFSDSIAQQSAPKPAQVQSVPKSVGQPISQSLEQSMNQPIPQPAQQPIQQSEPKPAVAHMQQTATDSNPIPSQKMAQAPARSQGLPSRQDNPSSLQPAVPPSPVEQKKKHHQPIIIVPPVSSSKIMVDHVHGRTTINIDDPQGDDNDVVVANPGEAQKMLTDDATPASKPETPAALIPSDASLPTPHQQVPQMAPAPVSPSVASVPVEAQMTPVTSQVQKNIPTSIQSAEYALGTDQGTEPLPKVKHVDHMDQLGVMNNIQTSMELGSTRSADGTVKSITEHMQGEIPSSLRHELEASSDRKEQYNSDPWAVYGGERGLFCRIQYYHDTVEFSPSCELVDYNLVDPEYHKPQYNCQFFEQRGILYFYGQKWMDCTPLSQRGKKVVFECGVQCAARQGQN